MLSVARGAGRCVLREQHVVVQVHRAIIDTQAVRDRHDLLGARVITSSAYAPLLERYNMAHVQTMPW